MGIGRRTAYDKRERDPDFAAAWDAALAPFARGERAYDRAPLAAFPAHAALAPLGTVSAECGAVSIDELEEKYGCSLDEVADEIIWSPLRGDVEGQRIANRLAAEIRTLAARGPRVFRTRIRTFRTQRDAPAAPARRLSA